MTNQVWILFSAFGYLPVGVFTSEEALEQGKKDYLEMFPTAKEENLKVRLYATDKIFGGDVVD